MSDVYLRGDAALLEPRQVGVAPRAGGPRRDGAQVLVEPAPNTINARLGITLKLKQCAGRSAK